MAILWLGLHTVVAVYAICQQYRNSCTRVVFVCGPDTYECDPIFLSAQRRPCFKVSSDQGWNANRISQGPGFALAGRPCGELSRIGH